jgi:ABC-2 type transport system ATP-binding protein
MVRLEHKAKAYVNHLSGGQKQRFSIVASLVNDPEIVFLDEPTTGLDPIARRNLWQIIADIKKAGKTVILTTHYMEEAEILCDRIAIMDAGKIVALDQTERLISQVKLPSKIMITREQLERKIGLKRALAGLGVLIEEAKDTGKYELHLKTQTDLNQALKLLAKEEPESFSVLKASLEDAFIELTGKRIAADSVPDEDAEPVKKSGRKRA